MDIRRRAHKLSGRKGRVPVSKELLILDLKRLKREFPNLTQEQYDEHGRYSTSKIRTAFGRFNDGKKAAGYIVLHRHPKTHNHVKHDDKAPQVQKVDGRRCLKCEKKLGPVLPVYFLCPNCRRANSEKDDTYALIAY